MRKPCSPTQRLGYKTAILSGGFTYFARQLQAKLGIDYVFANELQIVDGKVTGVAVEPIVDAQRKADLLRELAAKEGLALLNGTQVSTAYALRGLFEAEDLFAAATVCGGLSVEAMLGSRAPFDARIHAARGQRGQIDVAAAIATCSPPAARWRAPMRSATRSRTPIRCVASRR